MIDGVGTNRSDFRGKTNLHKCIGLLLMRITEKRGKTNLKRDKREKCDSEKCTDVAQKRCFWCCIQIELIVNVKEAKGLSSPW